MKSPNPNARPGSELRSSCIIAWALAASFSSAAPGLAADKITLGFAVHDWFTSVFNSKFLDECPEGLSVANDEVWWRGLPKEERSEITQNGLIESLARQFSTPRRGPDGAHVCHDMTVVTDPPMKVVEGKYSFGANIDGNIDGSPTPKTCKHGNFTHPNGTPGIDNQMYRLLGCIYGFRRGGLPEANAHENRRTSGLGMTLIEVTGVTDPYNSDDVTVTFYRSIDQFALDGLGQPLPYSSYNIDIKDGKPRYNDTVKGVIKDGVLVTERRDVSLPFYGNYNFMHPVIKDLGLRLEISPDGATAKGQVTGYYNVEEFLYYIGGMTGHVSGGTNCPSMYHAAHALADGYPDPETGKCTHLSSAYDIKAYAAFVIHPDKDQQTAQR
ncbi:MAG: hypothetical protein ACJZ9F_02975 [Rhodospirillaceae bacterium]